VQPADEDDPNGTRQGSKERHGHAQGAVPLKINGRAEDPACGARGPRDECGANERGDGGWSLRDRDGLSHHWMHEYHRGYHTEKKYGSCQAWNCRYRSMSTWQREMIYSA
jgi:hypothetical protein